MRRLALKARLTRYLKANPTWIAKGTLCDLARANANATGEHTGRRLRELENEKVVEVKYAKGHAYYRYRTQESFEELNKRQLAWFDCLPAWSAATAIH